MQFDDSIVVKFQSEVGATELFSASAQKAIVSSSYKLASSALSGTPSILLESVQLAPFTGDMWSETQRAAYNVHIRPKVQTAIGQSTRTDILTKGTVTLNASFPRAKIGVAATSVPDLAGLDDDIPVPVPTDAASLELARKTALLARLKANARNPDTVTEDTIDAWVQRTGAPTFSGFLDQAAASAAPLNQFILSFDPLPGTNTAAPIAFPIAVCMMIRNSLDPQFTLVDFLQASRSVLARMDAEGVEPKLAGGTIPPGTSIVAWLVPETWFDDDDWPGGDTGNAAAKRNDRISKATEWLAKNRIALVPISP